MDRALVILLALNFIVNAILICYLLPNTYINNLVEGILYRKSVEVETLHGTLWHCPALDGDTSLFCALGLGTSQKGWSNFWRQHCEPNTGLSAWGK
jgi:hypothetical protein